tara:strand:- start:1537 stop:1755 length:219 start_codon:yes stop_codon:yes gene_type:complete
MFGTEIITKEYLDRIYDEFSRELQNLQNKFKEETKETAEADITKQITLLNSLMMTTLRYRSLKRKIAIKINC